MERSHLCPIFLVILTIIALSSAPVYGLYHHVDDCTVCHCGLGGSLETWACEGSANLKMIREEILMPGSDPRQVVFTATDPYVRGAPSYDGICEVCHTTTKYYRNDGLGTDHPEYRPGLGGAGTDDKVPAIDFLWYSLLNLSLEPTNALLDSDRSTGDGWLTQNLCQSGICHSVGRYERIPGGTEKIVDMVVWTTDLQDNEKTQFIPGEAIRYHLSFYVRGPFAETPLQWCVRSHPSPEQGPVVGAYNDATMPGTDWQDETVMDETVLPRGEYALYWGVLVDRTVPANATPGSTARFNMELQLGNAACSELIENVQTSCEFSIVAP